MKHPDAPNGPRPRANPVADARAELEVGPGADQAEVRAAYLRLLKSRKPEVDPEGFRRLRAAYDLLRGLSAFVPQAPLMGGKAPRDVPSEPTPADIATVDELTEAPHESAPASATNHASEQAAVPAPLVVGVSTDVADHDPEARARAMCEAYERALRQPGVSIPPPTFVLDTMLHLHEIGALGAALALGRALYAWLEATGTESRYLRDRAAVVWAVLRDLAMLPETLPLQLRAAIAESARSGDLLGAREACMDYRARSERRAAQIAELLRGHAPTLHATLGSYLVYAPAPTKRATRGPVWLVFAAIMAMNALRSLVSTPESEQPRSQEHVGDNRGVIDAELAGLSEAVASKDCAEMQLRVDQVSAAMRAPGAWPTPNERARLSQLLRGGRVLCPDLETGKQK